MIDRRFHSSLVGLFGVEFSKFQVDSANSSLTD